MFRSKASHQVPKHHSIRLIESMSRCQCQRTGLYLFFDFYFLGWLTVSQRNACEADLATLKIVRKKKASN